LRLSKPFLICALLWTALLVVWIAAQVKSQMVGALYVIIDSPLVCLAVLLWATAIVGDVRLFRSSLIGGVAVGTIALVAGLVGPLLLSTARLGPLFGIFIAGPLGFVLGLVLGAASFVDNHRGRLPTTSAGSPNPSLQRTPPE